MPYGWVAAASVAGSLITSNAVSQSAKGQSKSADKAADLQKEQYDQTREDQAPFREAGYTGLEQLQQLLGLKGDSSAADFGMLNKQFTGADLPNDPGYQFGLQQGTQATERSASARGGLYSGATLKALQRYGTDYAGTKFNEAYNRDAANKDSMFNRLSGITGTGQTATNQVGAAGSAYANNVGNIGMANANAQGAAGLARGNILQGAINQGVSMWNQRQPATQQNVNLGTGSGDAWYGDYGDADYYPSDSRLKTNIQRIGTTERGSAVYTWDWLAGGRGIGVIAQEVAHIQGAVRADADGWLMVNYDVV